MPSIFVLMGPQGAGKGTQAQKLAESFNLPIIATGDMLRDIALTDTQLGRQVREVQAAGQLVSDDILAEVVKTRLSNCDCEGGCILDGFPRTLPQARLLERIAQARGHRICVVKIDVPRDLLFKRLTGRRTCTACGSIYHTEFKPPAKDGICDLDGQPLFTRSDDYPEAIENRLALYDEKTRPLLDYYGESDRLYKVDGTGAPEEVFDRIAEIVKRESASEREHKKMSDEL
ncbi:MAG TPA: adenylate kinase [Blastocatellia bacterium]|nr:adenylate kinase [Blastocatellia bacterium]